MDWSTEIAKQLGKGDYKKAVTAAGQAYLNASEVTSFVQLLDALYQAERFYDLQQELSNHSDLLTLDSYSLTVKMEK